MSTQPDDPNQGGWAEGVAGVMVQGLAMLVASASRSRLIVRFRSEAMACGAADAGQVGFGRWRAELTTGLRRVEQRGELASGADPDAATLLAACEGGVLLAGAAHDPAQLRIVLDAVAGLALGSVPAC